MPVGFYVCKADALEQCAKKHDFVRSLFPASDAGLPFVLVRTYDLATEKSSFKAILLKDVLALRAKICHRNRRPD